MMDPEKPVEFLVHLYQDGAFNRRELVRRVARVTGSLATAVVAVETLGVTRAARAQCPPGVRVPENAPDIEAQMVDYQGPGGTVFAYLARPRDGDVPRTRSPRITRRPAILVIHENRGLNDHTKDVARRAARAGFVGLAIDLVSRQGGTHNFPDPAQAGQAYNRVGAAAYVEDMLASVAYLKTLNFVQGDRLGVTGFCAGGGNTWRLVLNSPDIRAAVPYYGSPVPTMEELDRINIPVLAIYAEQDRNLTRGMAALIPGLLDRRKVFGFFVYEGVGHAFYNDTGSAYNPAAACDAWARTTAFFDKHLRVA